MPEPKTQRTTASVKAYLDAIADETRRADCKALAKLMQDTTGEKPAMWAAEIVGFGSYLVPAGKRMNEWPLVGFASRKANITIYALAAFTGADALLARLGKHGKGVGCLYIKRLADVDQAALREVIAKSHAWGREKFAR